MNENYFHALKSSALSFNTIFHFFCILKIVNIKSHDGDDDVYMLCTKELVLRKQKDKEEMKTFIVWKKKV